MLVFGSHRVCLADRKARGTGRGGQGPRTREASPRGPFEVPPVFPPFPPLSPLLPSGPGKVRHGLVGTPGGRERRGIPDPRVQAAHVLDALEGVAGWRIDGEILILEDTDGEALFRAARDVEGGAES